jgi:hypothetical protein
MASATVVHALITVHELLSTHELLQKFYERWTIGELRALGEWCWEWIK